MRVGDNRRAGDGENPLAELSRCLLPQYRHEEKHAEAEQPRYQDLEMTMLAAAEAEREQAGREHEEENGVVESLVFQESRSQRRNHGDGHRREQAMNHANQRQAYGRLIHSCS